MNANKGICAIIAMISLFFVLPGAQEKSKPYDYPVKPGTKEWKALASHEQKRQACQIPESTLIPMLTPDLVETCLNYPLYADMMAYDRVQDGFDYVAKGFNGLQELLKREGVGTVLVEKYRSMDPDSTDPAWISVKKGEYSLRFFSIEILLAQDAVITSLPENGRLQLLREAHGKILAKQRHPDVYGHMGFTNNALLMGRIMLKENYAPLVKLASRDGRLNGILKNAMPMGKEYTSEIVSLAEKYLKLK